MTPPLQLRALRGATTADANTADAIATAVAELVDALMLRNRLDGTRLLSVTFSVTADLYAGAPAAVPPPRAVLDAVALLDCQQMTVAGDLPRCIRLLAHAWLEPDRIPDHPYLRAASRLRPDRAHPSAATSPSDHCMPEG